MLTGIQETQSWIVTRVRDCTGSGSRKYTHPDNNGVFHDSSDSSTSSHWASCDLEVRDEMSFLFLSVPSVYPTVKLPLCLGSSTVYDTYSSVCDES